MDVLFVPGGFHFSAHVDAAVEWALGALGHRVKRLCRDCLRTIGRGALTNVKADLLLTVHGRRFPHVLLREVHYPTAVWLVDEPQEVDLSERYGRHFDVVFTNDPNTCGVHGPHKCWYLPLAADPRVHKPGPSRYGMVDVTFAGSVLPERAELLSRAYELTPEVSWRIVGPDRAGRARGFSPLARVWRQGTVDHAEYVELMRASRIVLDVPRDEMVSFAGRTNRRAIPAVGVNTRVFEATATGSFLLTSDARPEVSSLFPHGEVGLYRHGDAVDLAERIRHYLREEEEREDLAAAARETCLARHTYPARVRELLEVLTQWQATQMPPRPPVRRRARREPSRPRRTSRGGRAKETRK